LLDGARFALMVSGRPTVLRSTVVRFALFLGIAVAALLLSHSGTPIEGKTVQAQARLGTP
jgi:hypothetical protein